MLSADLLGRLGNQLFIYAMTRSIAERRGLGFWFDKRNWVGAGILDVYMGKADGVIKRIHGEDGSKYDPSVFDVENFTGFNGFWQNEKYFDHQKAREWFDIPLVSGAEKVLDQYPPNEYCFMHFRGNDYNVFPWNMYQVPNSYYEEAQARMLQIKPDLKFVFVTDDIQEVNNRFPGHATLSNSVRVDLSVLTHAKYLIISNSSLAWWSGWLNIDNTVIAPEGWFNYKINKGHFEPNGIKTDKFIWI